jgi:hypothetical protein
MRETASSFRMWQAAWLMLLAMRQTASRAPRWVTVAALVALLAAVWVVSFHRAKNGRYDFQHFYLDAEYVWTHGALNPVLHSPDPLEQRQLPFYLPALSVLIAPIGVGGRTVGALLWTAGHVVCLLYSLRVLARWCDGASTGNASPGTGEPSARRPRSADATGARTPLAAHETPASLAPLVTACALALPPIIIAAQFNQLSFLVLALLLGGADALERGRERRAGVLLAAAGVIKLLPLLFALWLVLKRRWRALAAYVAAAAALALLPPLLLFGPQRTREYHAQWVRHNLSGAPAHGMVDPGLPEHFIDRRNQSIGSVLARLLWPGHPYRVAHQPLQLSRETCIALAWGIKAVLLAALIWATRRPLNRGGPGVVAAGRREIALYMLAMLVLSPLVRQYYLIWALPALLVLLQAAARGATPAQRWIGRAAAGLWIAGLPALAWDTAREHGIHLVVLIALAGLLWAGWRVGQASQPVR